MAQYTFTEYFEKEVLRKRPYLKKEWCIRVLENAIRSEPQEGNRYRFWGRNEAPRSKLRGITEHSFEDFSETELNPVASYGESSS